MRRSLAAVVVALVAGVSRRAWAQACCAGGTVVTPAQLALHEDWAAGVQLRARANPGSFDAGGAYHRSTGEEQVLEQDVALSLRLTESSQVGILLPLLETHRNATGIDDWGGGLGDLALSGRYDLLWPGEALLWPGISVVAGATFPTGTPPDAATHPLAADATGEGSYDVTGGVALQQAWDHLFAGLTGWVTHRFARTVSIAGAPAIHASFAPRWTLLASGGYVFDSEAALGVQASMMNEGAAAVNGLEDPSSQLRLTTVSAAGMLPIRDRWRVQGALFADVPVSSFGRNEPAGYGLTAALVRVGL